MLTWFGDMSKITEAHYPGFQNAPLKSNDYLLTKWLENMSCGNMTKYYSKRMNSILVSSKCRDLFHKPPNHPIFWSIPEAVHCL